MKKSVRNFKVLESFAYNVELVSLQKSLIISKLFIGAIFQGNLGLIKFDSGL